MDADGCAMISETLQRQIERHVVRFTCGDFEPLAGIVINPPAETEDIDHEIKIDTHLATLGVKLSKADALSRYGRTEATDDDDALQPASNAPQNGLQHGFNGLPNEEQNKTPFNRDETPFKISRSDPDGQGDGSGLQELLGAFSRDLGPAADEVKKLLADLDAGKDVTEAAKALAEKLPELMPEDPAMAAVLAEEMARAFGEVKVKGEGEELANEGHPYTKCPGCGKFMSPAGNCEHCGFVEDDDRMIARGKKAIEQGLTGNRHDVPDAMHRKGLGTIDFDLGWRGKGPGQEHGSGLLKMDEKHFIELPSAPITIVKGDIVKLEDHKNPGHEDPNSVAIIHGTNIAILTRKKGKDRWGLFTHFKSDSGARKRIEASKSLKAPIS